MDENTIFKGQNPITQDPNAPLSINQQQINQNQPQKTQQEGQSPAFPGSPSPTANTGMPVESIPPIPSSFQNKTPDFVPPSSVTPPPPTSPPPPPTDSSSVDTVSSETEQPLPKKGGGFKKILFILAGLFLLFILFFGGYMLFQNFASSKNEKVTLEYWGLWEDSKVMEGVLSDFNRKNPNITVKYSKHDIKDYRQKLVNRIENGTGPDIFRFHNSWPLMIYSYLLPLPTDIVSSDEFKEWFYPVAQKDLIIDGAIYGIPLEIDTLSLYINNELFNFAGISTPTRWEDFASISAALTVKDEQGRIKKAGVALGTSNNISHASDIISLLFAQNGVDLENISSNQQNLSQALQYYTSFATGESNVWDTSQDNSLLAFSKGNLGMFFGYSYDYFSIKALNPDLDFKIVQAPKLAGRSLTIASYWVEGISAKSKHQKEALLFLKYLAQKETQQKLFSEQSKTRLFGEPYSRVDLADSLKGNDIVYPFLEQAKQADSSFFSEATFDQGLNEELNTYLYIAIDSIIEDNTSPESAAETLSKGFNQTLSKYGK